MQLYLLSIQFSKKSKTKTSPAAEDTAKTTACAVPAVTTAATKVAVDKDAKFKNTQNAATYLGVPALALHKTNKDKNKQKP